MIKTFLQNGKPFTAEVQRQAVGFFTGLSEDGQPDSQLAVEGFRLEGRQFLMRTAAGEVRGDFHVTDAGEYFLHLNGKHYRFTEAGPAGESGLAQGAFRSPMPGKVIAVPVQTGDRVEPGTTLAVVEAMKMENAIKTESSGVVSAVHCKPGELISPEDVLVELEVEEELGG